MVSPVLIILCTVLRFSIIQVKDLGKLAIKPVSILWPPNHTSRLEANMRLGAITDENNLDYSLVPKVRLRIICITIHPLLLNHTKFPCCKCLSAIGRGMQPNNLTIMLVVIHPLGSISAWKTNAISFYLYCLYRRY